MSAIPWIEELTPPPDPVDCCEALAHLPYRLFLDSAAAGALGRYSFVTADPVAVVRTKAHHAELIGRDGGVQTVSSPLDTIRAVLGPQPPHVEDLPPFQGGAAGYIAYDWGRTLERIPACRHDDLAIPDLVLGIYDWVLAWDHLQSRAWLISTGLRATPGEESNVGARRAAEVLEQLTAPRPQSDTRYRAMAVDPRHGSAPAFDVASDMWDGTLGIRSSFTRATYEEAVERVREYILAGDIFQANLSQRFDAPLTEPAWDYYRRLRATNPGPFAAFLDFPEVTVMSVSPERFLSVDPHGHVETRPIKGTRPRGVGAEHDALLARTLSESRKDRAENLMIVDLMRNDLSRVCLPGSVKVPELFALERYATVHHLVSTVTGELAPGQDALTLLAAAFPAGSITGAPKIRAMEIIAELEPSDRGVYCGAIGYWSRSGTMDTNVAIRTAVLRHGRVFVAAGGGITADSEPALEYGETLDKARGMIDALARPDGAADR